MARLTREQILKADDIKEKEIKVPEWGGEVVVKTLSAKERSKMMSEIFDLRTGAAKNPETYYQIAIYYGCVDPKFEKADIEALGDKSGVALERVGQAILRMAGLDPASIEEISKN